ncbi:nucleotidyltransferase family protein [candidate division WOR-3 bacterium]|nr:nucleotidyltransferase family protein [candidate division WOR-3 bacterium]
MKALILCAGYATRMYPLTEDRPKSLLHVANKPVIEYIIKGLEKVPEVDKIYIVTNAKFFNNFENWKKTYFTEKEICIISDCTTSDENKFGAIGDMRFVIETTNIDDDLIVTAGDNLYKLNMNDFVRFFRKNSTSIAVHDVKSKELVKKYNEVRLDDKRRVISFIEKPSDPKTSLAAICLYIFPGKQLGLINKYIEEGNNPDQPGYYIQWLSRRVDVFGYIFTERWYDIGDLNQYEKANSEYTKRRYGD